MKPTGHRLELNVLQDNLRGVLPFHNITWEGKRRDGRGGEERGVEGRRGREGRGGKGEERGREER